ncbi:uncharacterized protein BJ212DRAFT_1375704 [Suillus subaureus]|uniref:HMG box domain-containing protein n=1 Tax=Suillus subaureus TaxID=48587 RepID=A0A9P7JAM4_9AGAM|nr:uncharacterized protein BJ212DRAFT_1375704 [Suillus subaureus]KAG1811220.1 hypothetical protein BJ212DRAFT_1375704 [Suillus subaureus]
MPPKEPKEELDLDEKKAQLAIKFNNAARQFSALAEVLSKAVAEVPIDETTVNSLTELLNAAIAKPSRKRKLVALEIGEDGLPRKRKREKRAKDPNAPKGPASAYILFQNDIRSAYKKEHPDMSNKELLRLIGDQWKTLSEDKKDFYRDQHGRAKKKHEVDLAAYNAQNPDHVPAEAKDSEKKKKKKQEEPEQPATKEVAKAAPKATKKVAVPKVVPKSKEVVESSGSEVEDPTEVEASDAESSDDEPAPKAKAKATTDEDSESESEVDSSSEDEAPPPPPAKKSRK